MTSVPPAETRLQAIRLLQESRGLGEVILRVGEVGPSNARRLSLYVAGTVITDKFPARLGESTAVYVCGLGETSPGVPSGRLHRLA